MNYMKEVHIKTYERLKNLLETRRWLLRVRRKKVGKLIDQWLNCQKGATRT